MLPSHLRLSREGFKERIGIRRVHSAHFTITYKNNVPLGGSAVIVSKKVAPSSVERHLLKRRVREIIAPWSSPKTLLIISARAESPGLSFEQMKNELTSQLSSILGT